MTPIKIAISGVGNCASSLLQGIEYYKNSPSEDLGLMHRELGGFGPEDIQVVAAFDIDVRKVGRPLHEAIFAPPNCTKTIWKDVPDYGVSVQMGPILDGVADHMKEYHPDRTFVPAENDPVDVEAALRKSGAEILLNYMPVGSEKAARHYAEAALATGVDYLDTANYEPPELARFEYRWQWAYHERFGRRDIMALLGSEIGRAHV